MREDDRCFGDIEHVIHGFRGDVRQINQHAETVHFANNFPAELGQAFVAHIIRCRIRPVVAVKMRNRHVAHAELVIATQCTE